MLRIKNVGGERVRKGNYWNFSTGDRIHMEEAGTLPGMRRKSTTEFPLWAVTRSRFL
jgi:hypothetical protein